jgi:hypothetical protein
MINEFFFILPPIMNKSNDFIGVEQEMNALINVID